ncbi:neutral/alkaline non-lysosomal ceramidase N-terminal domain-containing protein [Lunatibacter salilacus]|uniref:neutral/alkaline non-lysosomal ceramidase N-terminal domain-containing protein n=1 Tax=Lunatibacter salilacus TaxID=2483804 RepID=UPI00131AA16C|nr:neutral/alkaline non-lysosomal ceramidase N-terminal domain-containing protein [Lunatibacter salilacus]
MLKLLLRFLIITLLFFVVVVFSTITYVDWTPYEETAYYHETVESLENLAWQSSDNGYFLAGWSKENITPGEPKPLIPYKPRGDYEFVLDSSYVKTLILGNNEQLIAFINYEILFVHPYLAQKIRDRIIGEKLPINHIYFTTTHTHSGYGGYSPGLIGRLTMGGLDEEVVDLLASETVLSLKSSLSSMDTATLSYRKTYAADFVTNRLIENDPIDPYIRELRIQKNSGETGSLLTFSAHSTMLPGRYMGLSGDYPFYLTKLQEQTVDFSLFASGTVGSHRPVGDGEGPKRIQDYAYRLDSVLKSDTISHDTLLRTSLRSGKLTMKLRSAHYRISDNLRLRPWLFDWAFGDSPAHLDIQQLGNLLFISSSGELSGVFYEEWEKLAQSQGLHLIVTCFNGGYIGYITPDKYYGEKLYEVRDMNFFGPFNGAYHSELVERIISSTQAK